MAKRTRVVKVSLEELVKQYASIGFAVEKRWINRLVKEKGLPRLSRGEYDLVACLKWYVLYEKQQAEKEKEKHGASRKSEDRLLAAKAGREELKFMKERGDVVRKDVFIRTLQQPMSSLRTKLLSLGKRTAPLVHGQTVVDSTRIIDEHVYEALRDLAELPARIRAGGGSVLGHPGGDIPDPQTPAKAVNKRVGRRVRAVKPRG